MLVELLKIAAIKVIKIVFCVILELGGFKRLKIKNNFFFLIVILELGGFKWFKNNKKRKNRNNDLFLLKLKK